MKMVLAILIAVMSVLGILAVVGHFARRDSDGRIPDSAFVGAIIHGVIVAVLWVIYSVL